MNHLKSILSITLVICLLFTVFPTVAYAENKKATAIRVGLLPNGEVELNSATPYLVNNQPSSVGSLGKDGCTAFFDAAEGYLYLENLKAERIAIFSAPEKDLIIVVKGDQNDITYINNNSGGEIIITDNNANASLKAWSIYAKDQNSASGRKNITLKGSVNVNIERVTTNNNQLTGIEAHDLAIEENAGLTIALANNSSSPNQPVIGIKAYGNVLFNTKKPIAISVDMKEPNTQNKKIYCLEINDNGKCELKSTPSLTLTFGDKGSAINENSKLPDISSGKWRKESSSGEEKYIYQGITVDPSKLIIPESIKGTAIEEFDLNEAVEPNEGNYKFTLKSGNPDDLNGLELQEEGIISGAPANARAATKVILQVENTQTLYKEDLELQIGMVRPETPTLQFLTGDDANITTNRDDETMGKLVGIKPAEGMLYYKITGGNYAMSDFTSAQIGKTEQPLSRFEADGPFTIQVKYVIDPDNENIESLIQSIPVHRPNKPANLSVVNTSSETTQDGKITGVTSDMQYKKNEAYDPWKDCTNAEITNLEKGAYLVRIKAQNGMLASKSVEIEIKSSVNNPSNPNTNPSNPNTNPSNPNTNPSTPNTNPSTPSATPSSIIPPYIPEVSSTLTISQPQQKKPEETTQNGKVKETDKNDKSETSQFTDVAEGAWYKEAVSYVSQRNLMNGISQNSFAPNKAASRGMLITILYRLAGSPKAIGGKEFMDVSNSHYSFQAVKWATQQGIAKGYSDTIFGMQDNITREQLVTLLMKFAEKNGKDVSKRGELSTFADVANVSNYAKDAISWANSIGLLKGNTQKMISPQAPATRAEIAELIRRFCEDVLK